MIFVADFILQTLAEKIIGFDCSMGQNNGRPNITTWSIMEPKACGFHRPEVIKRAVTIQVLETKHSEEVTVIQCKVKIRRTLRRCSIFNYLEPVDNGLQEYLLDISHDACLKMHDTRTFVYDSMHVIYDPKPNDTTSWGMLGE